MKNHLGTIHKLASVTSEKLQSSTYHDYNMKCLQDLVKLTETVELTETVVGNKSIINLEYKPSDFILNIQTGLTTLAQSLKEEQCPLTVCIELTFDSGKIEFTEKEFKKLIVEKNQTTIVHAKISLLLEEINRFLSSNSKEVVKIPSILSQSFITQKKEKAKPSDLLGNQSTYLFR